MFANNFDPNGTLYGQWTQIDNNERFVFSVGGGETVNTMQGRNMISYYSALTTLTKDQIPSHNHELNLTITGGDHTHAGYQSWSDGSSPQIDGFGGTADLEEFSRTPTASMWVSAGATESMAKMLAGAHTHTYSGLTENSGNSQPHNHLYTEFSDFHRYVVTAWIRSA